MIIHTTNCEFLIECHDQADGCVYIYSDSLEEIQRLFGSLELEYANKNHWKYKVKTCKQEFANALILMVKEINYTNFNLSSLQQL